MVSIPTAVPPGAGGAGTGGSPASDSGGTTPIQGGPSTSLTGWNHFMRSLAEILPSRSHEARMIRRAAMQELQAKRKVHR